MPINYLHSLFHRVEDGWDPITNDYASSYTELAWNERSPKLIEDLEIRLGGFAGKRVLDLGGGPGQYSVLFAQKGADVTWHDVSREYESITRERAAAAGVTLRFSLGYLEDTRHFQEQFDLLFCRVCWYYARNDRAFSRLLYSLIKPAGVGYVECNTPAFSQPQGWRKLQYWLNSYLWFKVGHPMPPHGRIARLLLRQRVNHMTLDYSSPLRDIVIFTKALPQSALDHGWTTSKDHASSLSNPFRRHLSHDELGDVVQDRRSPAPPQDQAAARGDTGQPGR